MRSVPAVCWGDKHHLSRMERCAVRAASLPWRRRQAGSVTVGDDNDVAWGGGVFKNPDIVHVTNRLPAH